jgi:Domain of unknown function (DUF4193)
MEDNEELLEEEEIDEEETPDLEADDSVPPPAAEGEEVESIQDLLVKQEAREEEAEAEDDSVLALSREERLEPLAVKVVPPQPTEFICKSCYLVKHRSQLKDKTRQLCRDCA